MLPNGLLGISALALGSAELGSRTRALQEGLGLTPTTADPHRHDGEGVREFKYPLRRTSDGRPGMFSVCFDDLAPFSIPSRQGIEKAPIHHLEALVANIGSAWKRTSADGEPEGGTILGVQATKAPFLGAAHRMVAFGHPKFTGSGTHEVAQATSAERDAWPLINRHTDRVALPTARFDQDGDGRILGLAEVGIAVPDLTNAISVWRDNYGADLELERRDVATGSEAVLCTGPGVCGTRIRLMLTTAVKYAQFSYAALWCNNRERRRGILTDVGIDSDWSSDGATLALDPAPFAGTDLRLLEAPPNLLVGFAWVDAHAPRYEEPNDG